MKVALDDMGVCHTPWTWGEVRSRFTLLNESELRRGQGAPKKTPRTMDKERQAHLLLSCGEREKGKVGKTRLPCSEKASNAGREEHSMASFCVKTNVFLFFIRDFIK